MAEARAMESDIKQWFWDIVERSHGGHERRRRLAWRMTLREATQWQATYGGVLERVDESKLRLNIPRPPPPHASSK